MKLEDVPLVLPLAEWIWGGSNNHVINNDNDNDTFNANDDQQQLFHDGGRYCLSQVPFLSSDCLEPLITKLTGVGIILGACFNKAPTMMNMIQAQSAEGFSRSGLYSEALFYANSSIYSILMKHPFTAYGENFVLLIQTVGMISLMWKFDKVPLTEQSAMIVASLVYTLAVVWILPEAWRYLLHGANDIVIIYSGGAQVLETVRVKHTGAQSIVTTSMNLIGEMLRIFTTLEETDGDINMLLSFALCALLSITMFGQYFWYQTNTQQFFVQQEEKKKKKKQ